MKACPLSITFTEDCTCELATCISIPRIPADPGRHTISIGCCAAGDTRIADLCTA
jgi:hypothetical protein